MRKINIAACLMTGCVLLAGCSFTSHHFGMVELKGKTKTVKKETALDQYSEYSFYVKNLSFIGGVPDIKIEPSEHTAVEVTYNEDLEDYGFYIRIQKDVISIGTDCKKQFKGSDFSITIHANITKCIINGTFYTVWVAPADRSLQFESNGAAISEMHQVKCNELNAVCNGASNLKLDGAVKKAQFELNGSSVCDGKKLVSNEFITNINGTGRIELSVLEKLHASINGSGTVSYYGSPEVTKEIYGPGKIEQISSEIFQ